MQQYKNLVNYVLKNGTIKQNRTGIRTLSTFNYNYEIDLQKGFPLLTTKKIDFKNIVIELLWFISGHNHIEFLNNHGIHFWDPWLVSPDFTGTQYHYWTQFPDETNTYIDQLKFVYDELLTNPMSRRMVVTAWDPRVAWEKELLPPCHLLYIFNVQIEKDGTKTLNLHLTQRSADIGLGIPFNLSSYSLLLTLMAKITGLKPGKFAHSLIDAHIYIGKEDGDEFDHRPALAKQMARTAFELSQLELIDINNYQDLLDLAREDLTTEQIMSHFKLNNYQFHQFIKMSPAV